MTVAATEMIHAGCVAIDGLGVLLMGPSGSGKSDLALRLLDRGAMLISDDYTILSRNGDRLQAAAPPPLSQKIEVRGIGIVNWQAIASVQVALCLLLDQTPERMPEPSLATRQFLGIELPALGFSPFECSAPLKAELALRTLVDAPHKNGQDC